MTASTLLPPPAIGPDYAGAGARDFCEDRSALMSTLDAFKAGRVTASAAATAFSNGSIALGAAQLSLQIGGAPSATVKAVGTSADAATELSDLLGGGRSEVPLWEYEDQLENTLATTPISC